MSGYTLHWRKPRRDPDRGGDGSGSGCGSTRMRNRERMGRGERARSSHHTRAVFNIQSRISTGDLRQAA